MSSACCTGVFTFGITIPTYDVPRSSRCLKVSDDVIDHVLAVCVRVRGSSPVGRRPCF